MRCLYCGKELALLKRWRGGGEFCSDAHRQQYRQEYDELALTRLLQATPLTGVDASSTQEPEDTTLSATTDHTRPARGMSPTAQPPAQAPVAKSPPQWPADPPRVAPQPAATTAPVKSPATLPSGTPVAQETSEPRAPAEARLKPVTAAPASVPGPDPDEEKAPVFGQYCAELPVPQAGTHESRSIPLAMIEFAAPVFPGRPGATVDSAAAAQLASAGRISLGSARATDHSIVPRGRGVEVREFARMLPVLETSPAPVGLTSLETSIEPLPVPVASCKAARAALWMAPERELGELAIELGELARLDLAPETSGDAVHAPEVHREFARGVVREAARQVSGGAAVEPARIAVEESVPDIAPLPQATSLAVPGRELSAVGRQRAFESMPVTMDGIFPSHGRAVQVFSAPILSTDSVQIPRTGAMPLRPLIVLGPRPGSPPNGGKEPPATEMAVPSKPAVANAGKPNGASSATPPGNRQDADRPAASAVQAKPPAARRAAPAKSAGTKPGSSKLEGPDQDAPKVDARQPGPETDGVKPAGPKPAGLKPAGFKPDGSKANGPKPAGPKPELVVPAAEDDIPKAAQSPGAPPLSIDLGLPSLKLHTQESFWGRLPAAAKIGLAAAVVLAASGVVYLTTSGGHATANTAASNKPAPVMESGPAGDLVWLPDWAPDADAKRGRRISMLRGSMPLSDYRVEFESQIDSKATGWVYRAKDPNNYYVNRLEILKSGPESKIALVRFAVLDGQEQPRTQLPLSIPVHPDSPYKIRFEARKDRFSTWIGDQKIDEWSDTHLRSGGFGMYSEKGESSSMKGSVSVIPLASKD